MLFYREWKQNGRKNILILDNNDENDNLVQGLFVRIKKLVDEPVINTIGKQWIASELKKKKRKWLDFNSDIQ